jgi:hypothetical protein
VERKYILINNKYFSASKKNTRRIATAGIRKFIRGGY